MPDLQIRYIIVSVVVLVVGLVLPWIDTKINGISIRPFLFGSLVVFGLVPAIHGYSVSPPVQKLLIFKVNSFIH